MPEVESLVDALDLSDPSFIADPYPTLNRLREATPSFFYEPTNQHMFTRFDEVHAALRHRGMGRTYRHRFTDAEFGRPEPDTRFAAFRQHDRWSLLELEPPDHTRIRQLISKVFTPRAVANLRPMIVDTASRLLDACADAGEFDLVADYGQPYSVAIICEMLGVPVSDGPRLLDWSHRIVKWYELVCTDEMRLSANAAAAEFMEYTREVIADKRRAPKDDLISALVGVEEQGARLTDDEIVSTVIVLLNAGHEATVNSLGNGMRALMQHPGEWRRLTTAEVSPRVAVEEVLRWDAPLQLFERWVLDDDVVLGGTRLAFGSEIVMLFGAANRDPRHFVDPDRFDIGRGDASHIEFGGGIHFCVGAPLARLELEISLEHLARRFPSLHLTDEPAYHPTFVIRGLTGLKLAA